jgi:hypothetical protein
MFLAVSLIYPFPAVARKLSAVVALKPELKTFEAWKTSKVRRFKPEK